MGSDRLKERREPCISLVRRCFHRSATSSVDRCTFTRISHITLVDGRALTGEATLVAKAEIERSLEHVLYDRERHSSLVLSAGAEILEASDKGTNIGLVLGIGPNTDGGSMFSPGFLTLVPCHLGRGYVQYLASRQYKGVEFTLPCRDRETAVGFISFFYYEGDRCSLTCERARTVRVCHSRPIMPLGQINSVVLIT
jgi:hypothetical protein